MRLDPGAQDCIHLDLENPQKILSAQSHGQLVLLFNFVSGKTLALIYIQPDFLWLGLCLLSLVFLPCTADS